MNGNKIYNSGSIYSSLFKILSNTGHLEEKEREREKMWTFQNEKTRETRNFARNFNGEIREKYGVLRSKSLGSALSPRFPSLASHPERGRIMPVHRSAGRLSNQA